MFLYSEFTLSILIGLFYVLMWYNNDTYTVHRSNSLSYQTVSKHNFNIVMQRKTKSLTHSCICTLTWSRGRQYCDTIYSSCRGWTANMPDVLGKEVWRYSHISMLIHFLFTWNMSDIYDCWRCGQYIRSTSLVSINLPGDDIRCCTFRVTQSHQLCGEKPRVTAECIPNSTSKAPLHFPLCFNISEIPLSKNKIE